MLRSGCNYPAELGKYLCFSSSLATLLDVEGLLIICPELSKLLLHFSVVNEVYSRDYPVAWISVLINANGSVDS